MDSIRNFSIIAHIDHGKSTLADRMIECTKTVADRKMREQVLDSMDLERERGITIKMQPVRMAHEYNGQTYTLNLIDTPGHIDFSYEVSRALKAVEGSILLVDATQGVQAQTFTTLAMARKQDITIIPVVTKIDAPHAQVEETIDELALLLEVEPEDVLCVSGKTGEHVPALLDAIIERIAPPTPDPRTSDGGTRALVFDFDYDTHRGIVVYARVFGGTISKKDALSFVVADEKFTPIDIGVFAPEPRPTEKLEPGEIGYIVTGIKEPGIVSVGDTLIHAKTPLEALPGYQEPRPVVWASLYPESQDDFAQLTASLQRLQLTDSSLSFEEEASGVLGRGYRCGFLGMLHLEIVAERLRREFQLELIVTTPSITYHVTRTDGEEEVVYSPHQFPDDHEIKAVHEPWAAAKIIVLHEHVGTLMQLLYEHEASIVNTETLSHNRTTLSVEIPLRELMRNFFDEVKSATSGFASLSYEIIGNRPAEVVRMDVLVGGDPIPAFAQVVSRKKIEETADDIVDRLHGLLPRQMFVVKIQAHALGRIIASRTLKAYRKDVTAKLYGGDVTRKKKLREKQKKGKKKMQQQGSINIPHDVFLKMMRRGD